jgi:hypothetical protein
MEYFVIQRHEDCLEKLIEHDVCGVNWHQDPSPHFSGNFWWARSSYIVNLRPLTKFMAAWGVHEPDPRRGGEFWIGSHSQVRLACLHESAVNHYETAYPRSRYALLGQVICTEAFHPASAWCGLENRFQDLLEPLGSIRTIVEFGVEYGYSLFCLAAATPQATVIGIDPYEDLSPWELERMKGLGTQAIRGTKEAEAWVRAHCGKYPNILLLRDTSENVARRLSGSIDVVHLDAVHVYGDIAREFALWEPLIRPGGCMLFHDTEAFPDDVGEFLVQLPGRKAHISGYHGLGAWYKTDTSDSAHKSLVVADQGPKLSLCRIARDSIRHCAPG